MIKNNVTPFLMVALWATAQGQCASIIPAVIPTNKLQAEQAGKSISDIFDGVGKLELRATDVNPKGHVFYYFYDSKTKLRAEVNALSGDIDAFLEGTDRTEEEVSKRIKNSQDENILREKAEMIRKEFYIKPEILTLVQSNPGGGWVSFFDKDGGYHQYKSREGEWKFIYRELKDKQLLLNTLSMDFFRDSKKLQAIHAVYRPALATSGKVDELTALALLRWKATEERASPVRIVPTSEFTKEQSALTEGMGFAGEKAVLLKENEDSWLYRRWFWRINTNLGSASIDEFTGKFLEHNLVTPLLEDVSQEKNSLHSFALPSPKFYPKPAIALNKTSLEESGLVFNGQILSSISALHFPPIIRDNSAFIFAEYFPKFLIDVTRKGNHITLQGKLKEKGKSATLTLGQTKAVVDGKEVEFASSPVEIDGRLYLPAELLQSCNGIPIRWEPKKKTLWVETRYLRRDGDETAALINEP